MEEGADYVAVLALARNHLAVPRIENVYVYQQTTKWASEFELVGMVNRYVISPTLHRSYQGVLSRNRSKGCPINVVITPQKSAFPHTTQEGAPHEEGPDAHLAARFVEVAEKPLAMKLDIEFTRHMPRGFAEFMRHMPRGFAVGSIAEPGIGIGVLVSKIAGVGMPMLT